MSRSSARSALAVVAILLFAGASSGGEIEHGSAARLAPASLIELRLSGPSVGVPERPAVEFRHDLHEAALTEEGCKACHVIDEKKGLVLWLKGTEAVRDEKDPRLVKDPDAAMEAFHKACIGCHTERAAASKKSGPRACGQCHVARPEAVSARQPVVYDSSLHARHVKAVKEVQGGKEDKDRCDLCHHEYDKDKKKLVYVENQEGNCGDCHGAQTVEKNLSLRDGAHVLCVSCHLERRARKEDAGPVQCEGCHEAGHQKSWKKISPIPRLKRKDQPDVGWIRDESAKSQLVPFPHEKHESTVRFCPDCHHRTLKKCRECHTLTGKPEGKGITLEQAYHGPTSTYSCVGCHVKQAASRECAGCHRMQVKAPGETSCTICHAGPKPADAEAVAPASVLGETPVLPPLPKFSDDYPEKLDLKLLAKEFKASEFPHGKIVAKLEKGLLEKHLAGRFHGLPKSGPEAGPGTGFAANGGPLGPEGGHDILCAGCHHETPVGRRPPPCASCHGPSPDPDSDKPRLLAAYHRQCMGCHQAMRLPTTCTHCHKKADDKATQKVTP